MGKTYRREPDFDGRNSKKPKNHNHSNNKKSGGMRIVNEFQDWDEDDDYFDDEVNVRDSIVINKTSDEDS